MVDDSSERTRPISEIESRRKWVEPEISVLNAQSAQAGPGDTTADATEFS